jgi:DNA polymerase
MTKINFANCTKCPNLVLSRTQIVFPTISKRHSLLVIGEAPGRDEDIRGEGFVGVSGITLARLLNEHGIVSGDYAKANICWCRPPDNRKPTPNEIANCLPYLAEFISTIKPRVVLTVGSTPTKVFCGAGNLYDKINERSNNSSAAKCSETVHPILKSALKFIDFVVPTPHTSPLAFNRNAPSGEKWSVIAKRQIALAVTLLK